MGRLRQTFFKGCELSTTLAFGGVVIGSTYVGMQGNLFATGVLGGIAMSMVYNPLVQVFTELRYSAVEQTNAQLALIENIGEAFEDEDELEFPEWGDSDE